MTLIKRIFLKAKALRRRALLGDIYERMKPFTMIPKEIYIDNLELISRFRDSVSNGAVVECGTWRGGMLGGIGMLLRHSVGLHGADSFCGLPEAKEIDGLAARQFQSNTQDPFYYNNATASREVFEEAMKTAGCKHVQIHEGWFEDTLPHVRPTEGIGVLRLDGDWFDSTMTCPRQLFPLVLPGGLVIVDDYLAFEGCSKAVHKYLADEVRPEALRTWNSRVYYIIKSPESKSAGINRGTTASTAQSAD